VRVRRLAYDGAIYGRSELRRCVTHGTAQIRRDELSGVANSWARRDFRPTSGLHFFPEAQAPEATLLMLLSLRYFVPRSEQSSGRGTAVPGL
jgi:hypothetical protein